MKAGLNLIELLVVIAVLAAVITPHALKAIEKAKVTRACSDLETVKTACLSYYADTGRRPISNSVRLASVNEALRNTDLLNNNNNYTGWNDPYLENEPMTSRGSAYWLVSWSIEDAVPPLDLAVVISNNRYSDLANNIVNIPVSSIQRIGVTIDDGNLNSGDFRTVADFGGEGDLIFYWGTQ